MSAIFMINRPLVVKSPPTTQAHGGVITTNGDVLQLRANDLKRIVAHVFCSVAGGTVTLVLEYSLDGVNWIAQVTKHETDFPGSATGVIEVALETTTHFKKRVRDVRLRASALGAGGTYGLVLKGERAQGYA